jgi:hypothetical protein
MTNPLDLAGWPGQSEWPKQIENTTRRFPGAVDHEADRGSRAATVTRGCAATNFGQRDAGLFGWGLRGAMMFARPPEPGANTIVHLASSPQLADVNGRRSRRFDAQRLWQESEKIAGLFRA